MPFPPPPPPPGPPPPPTFSPPAPAPAASPEGRNLLLQSIRQGATLKKTVTNDRSAPVVGGGGNRPGSSSSSSGGGGSPRPNGGINGSATLGRNNGLAGLFAGGMPKLKPTGVDIGQSNSQSLTSLPSATATGEQTRRQFNVDIKNRGPPPKPPPASQKPAMPQSTSDSVLTGPLHNRSNSTTSLNMNNTWTPPAQGIPKVAMKAPPGGYGKPNLAPKPPGIASKSPGKLVNGRSSVTRAQSMRAPRSPPVAPPTGQMSLLPNQSDLHRGAPMFHQSQDSLLATPPPPKHHTLPSPRAGMTIRPPLRPPQSRPPPPPPNKVMMSSPPCPPPPPPTQAPPPPPHRVPPVPPMCLNPAPPPPPARHSSMRNGLPPSFSSKLEARFAEKFHMKEEFPPPQPFMNVDKVYSSRTSKQQAPQPPHQHIQLHWSRDNTSTC